MKVAQKPFCTGLASTSAESEPRPATGRASPYRPQHAMSPRVFSQSIQSFHPSNGTYQPLSMTTMNNAFAPENGVGINGTSSTSSSNTTTTNSNNSNKNTTAATASTSSSTSNTANSTMTAHTINGAFASGPHSVLIRRLPINTTEDTLRLMVVWSKEFLDADVLSPEKSEDAGFRCAILRFKTHGGALEAKNMLDGKPNIANDAQMSVEVLYTSPTTARRYTMENPAPGPSSSTSSTASSTGPAPRQSSRFNGSFQSSQRLSPTNINASYASNELPNPGDSAHYQSLFSPQSPIGNHLTERTRITGKSLIKNDCVDDDETGELLKDPVAYAQNGPSTQGRRPTIPQIPISRMAGFCLNKTSASGSATMSNFAKNPSGLPNISQGNPMSPTSVVTANGGSGGGGPPVNYQLGSQHYQRHNFPPVNPADQNPPCNTLYVGNLPIDTSEDELKAMFSKQRGYKRLCFRTKQNGPMCFVEFEDVSFATKALHELYGHPLHNSIKGGIRLSFSKNPLGVRSGQGLASPVPPNATGVIPGMNGSMLGAQATSFSTASGPPPGLAAPPGLSNRMGFVTAPIQPLPNISGGYAGTTFLGSHSHTSTHSNNTTNHNNHHTGWHGPVFNGAMSAGGTAPLVNGGSNGFPPAYMMGR